MLSTESRQYKHTSMARALALQYGGGSGHLFPVHQLLPWAATSAVLPALYLEVFLACSCQKSIYYELVASALIRETMHNFLQDVACIVDSMCCHSHYRQQACLHCSRHTLLVVCSGSFDFEEEQDLAIDELQDEQQQQQQQPSPGAAVFITSLRGCVYLCWLWYLHCLLTCMSSAPTKSSRCCTWGLGGDLSLLCLITIPQFSLNLGHKTELPLQSANWLTYLCEFCRGLEPQAVPQRNGRAKCSGERRCLLEACVI